MKWWKPKNKKTATGKRIAWGNDTLPVSVDQNVPVSAKPKWYGKKRRRKGGHRLVLVAVCVLAGLGALAAHSALVLSSWPVLSSQESFKEGVPAQLTAGGWVLHKTYQQVAGNTVTVAWKGEMVVSAKIVAGVIVKAAGEVIVGNERFTTTCVVAVGGLEEQCSMYRNQVEIGKTNDHLQQECWVRQVVGGTTGNFCVSNGYLFPLVLPNQVVSVPGWVFQF